ncbi:hypothetical protein R3P38DRAFT_2918856 [Favolaschia claudopus]|uniref:Uncharacterized protein n=1 Tax=Favolaschia claudopus TaxID=2862362 RepID=A0AAW0C387_9AGAR
MSLERYYHPFHEDPQDWDPDDGDPGTWPPKTLAELRMCRLSAQLRRKPRWWEKIQDEKIRTKWIQEVKEQQVNLPRWEKLTDNMVNYVMDEMRDGYAALRDPDTGIECGPYERIFLSDALIPEDVGAALKLAVRPLEDIPDEEKDWHPGSDGQVLDLVHPSICPLVFEETWGRGDDGSVKTFDHPEADDLGVDSMFVSLRFQWLPSDFRIHEDGTLRLISPYINNIYPKHHDTLIPVIERVMAFAIPLWDRVLSSLKDDPLPARVTSKHENPSEVEADTFDTGISCIWEGGRPSTKTEEEEREQEQDYDAWLLRRLNQGPLILPEASRYEGALENNLSVKLAGSDIQVIAKLANIVLTPDKPEYPGGTWHVEGMATESIVSTFIYYYESDNIEPCDLKFRMATRPPEYHEQDDSTCMRVLYGMNREAPCVQDIGSVETKAGRCIAFPNLYQHCVSPFQLVDKTKPGVRKILAFFLIDPTIKIPSASNVPPQQLQVMSDILRSQGPSSRLSLLPLELLDYIATLVPGVRSRAEAEAIREEVMEERTVVIESVNTEFFSREFNMCEH